MPPQSVEVVDVLPKPEDDVVAGVEPGKSIPHKYKYNWPYITVLTFFQISGLYGLCQIFTSAKLLTTFFGLFYMELTLLGVTAGAHRYWSHKSFKAKLPLRYLLAVLQAAAYQENIFMWARNHRLHHKYPDDDADPYNPKRGYFFAHCGWLMVKRHPRSVEKGRLLDMSDVLSDPAVQFQKKYYYQLVLFLCFILPVVIPVHFWGESWLTAWNINSLRWTTTLHCALAINSIAHMHGLKPYDRRIGPSNQWLCSLFCVGEGAHNYHHVFPWDYRSIEMNTFYFNATTYFIDLMAKIGWAYDLKFATEEMIENRVQKTGIPLQRPKKIEYYCH